MWLLLTLKVKHKSDTISNCMIFSSLGGNYEVFIYLFIFKLLFKMFLVVFAVIIMLIFLLKKLYK